MLKKVISFALVVSIIFTSILVALPKKKVLAASSSQVSIPYVDSLPNQPVNYNMIDWNQRARNFDSFVFDFSTSGTYRPIALWDATHYNMDTTTFKIPAYVGPVNAIQDGKQEAVAGLASVLGGALTGVDKSNQTGNGYSNVDFVDMCRTYYTAEGIINNYPNGVTKGEEFWYVLLPTLEFAALDSMYPSSSMDSIMQNTANKWYDAIVNMGGSNVNFNYLGYDFTANAAFTGSRTEPDAAIAAGLFEYWAYKKFGTAKYLDAASWCMNFLQNQNSNVSYEALQYWGALFAAKLNAEQGKSNDVTKMINWAFNTDSTHRPNWGGLKGTFGSNAMDGLMGSSIDNGGNYAFTMNTFAAAMGIVPVARYDQRYARAIGKWMLNAASNSRLYYGDQISTNLQDDTSWTEDTSHAIPYEGLRYHKINDSSKAPFATGDPLTYSWPYNTNYGIYSGALSGVFGGIISTTNVSQILSLDLLKTDFFHGNAYPSYLYYNPYSTSQSVQMNVGSSACDIYDAVSDTFIKTNVSGTQNVTISADSALVIVLSPANGTKTISGNNILINNVFVGYNAPAAGSANLALNKTATASSTVNGNVASNVTDGSGSTRWESATNDPQWIYVDLGTTKTIGSVKLTWEAAYAKSYKIQISKDAINWTDVYSTTTGTGGIENISFNATSGRYVRTYGTQRGTSWAYSMYEFEVYAANNLALNKTAIASSTVNGNVASNVTDGFGSTRWESATNDPQWIYVDLGTTKTIGSVKLTWEAAYAKSYKIQISKDAINWTDVYSTTTGTGGTDNISFNATSGRYVRMYGTQRGTSWAYSMYEFEVYAATNLALNKTATASSTANGNAASNVTDGSGSTRWESATSDPQWIYIDLGSAMTVRKVILNWEAAYGKSYKIQVSNDAINWTDVYSTTTGAGGIDDISFSSTSARYVRMYGTQRGTSWAYSIYEFEVY